MRKTLILMMVILMTQLTACGGGGDDDGNALMKPGEDCLAGGCHGAGSNKPFTVAGTVFAARGAAASAGLANVSVVVTDANGVSTALTTNAAGNFYTGAAMAQPLASVYVLRGTTRTNMGGAPQGACASCHAAGSGLGYVYAN
jgi:hypothetical protein